MKNNESATDILLNLNLSQINEIVNFSASLAEGELNISNTVDVISKGFFSAFYNTASYYVNCALEYMTPILGGVCSYFREDTSKNEIYYDGY
ncbi:MAG: hypothetical protein ACIPMY_04725 [Rickettsia endosymbiont of Pentastiridius leporinus]